MADVELSYKGSTIGSMSASGSLTLETAGKYCEDDIEVEYTKPSGPTPTGTKAITISGPGTVTEDVTNYAAAEITVPAGSAATPATTVPVTPAISVDANGLITASVSESQSVTPSVSAGYVSSGTAGTVNVSGSNTQQLTVYNGEHHQPTPSGYTVTVSLTNPVHPSSFYGCYIQDFTNDTLGEEIGRITSPTGSIELAIPASITQITITLDGMSVDYEPSNISCVGDVSRGGYTGLGGDKFSVTGNGTITYDDVDYDG